MQAKRDGQAVGREELRGEGASCREHQDEHRQELEDSPAAKGRGEAVTFYNSIK